MRPATAPAAMADAWPLPELKRRDAPVLTPGEIDKHVLANRQPYCVLYTEPNGGSQLVAVWLPPRANIGEEVHTEGSQTVVAYEGGGTVRFSNPGSATMHSAPLLPHKAWFIPTNTKHDVVAGPYGLALLMVYSWPRHADDV